MRIALTTYALHVGGMETFILSLADGLVRGGHEVHVVTTDERGAWFERTPEVGAQGHFLDGALKSRAGHARDVARFLADAGFDAVINNFSWFAQASLGLLPAQTVTVSVIHNAAEIVVALACANSLACQAVVAVSPKTFELARPRVGASSQLHLINYGVQVPDYPVERPSSKELRVIFCGRLEHTQKGVFLMPEIVRQVSESGVDLRLEIAGEGPDRDQLVQLLREQGVPDRVRLLGALNHAETIRHIRESDVLILPSFFEGLPIVALEAVANAAVPVLSLLPGITDWIVDSSSGFLPPAGDAKGFSEALIHLGRDPDLRRRMSVAAWQRALARFSVTTMVESYIRLIEELRSQAKERPSATRRHGLAPDLVKWQDYLPPKLRHAGGRLLRGINASR
jgi:glycosyltransferase involved in cell wall biosynthesis